MYIVIIIYYCYSASRPAHQSHCYFLLQYRGPLVWTLTSKNQLARHKRHARQVQAQGIFLGAGSFIHHLQSHITIQRYYQTESQCEVLLLSAKPIHEYTTIIRLIFFSCYNNKTITRKKGENRLKKKSLKGHPIKEEGCILCATVSH